ncbi:hypothetical protein ACHQM5_028049 [Ranunculus cassubicifolius]
MSRCFPFPPPGYEKKARTEEVELQIKDKQKEKKHKKEKKDKKKEGKDKDKDRSKDKDRDKKERKEKHKDKKSKDKRKTDESKLEGPGECSNGGKLLDNNQQPEATKNTKFVDINPRVVADEERGRRNQMAENHFSTTDRREDEGGVGKLVDKYFDNWVQDKENIKGKDEPDKKIERQRVNDDEGRILGKAMVTSFSSAEQRRLGATVRPTEKDAATVSSFSSAEQRRVGAAVRPMEKEAATITSFSSAEQRKVGVTVRPMEKDAERKMEAKEKKKDQVVIEAPRKLEGEEKKKEQVGNDVARKTEGKEKKKDSERKEKKKDKEGKHKHRDGEKKSKEKKSSEKEKMKEKAKNENRIHDDKMIIEQVVPKVDHINTLNIKPIQIPTPKDSDTGSREDALNFKKRKESDTNGFVHDNVVLPNKLPRPTISSSSSPSLPLTMNGRKQELSQPQPISPFAVAVQRGPNSIRFDNKVLKANGLLQAPPPPPTATSTSSSLPSIKAKENGESSRKPHPDTKYLSQILSVPKMDDWSDFDDQEWLFSSQGKKNSSGMEDDIPQVWDRAMQIDSADLCALPYVIPY